MFPAMLGAIDAAAVSVSFETYIFAEDQLGAQFRTTLLAAVERGVRVRVLVDALGSMSLPSSFWEPLRMAGACRRVRILRLCSTSTI